jgi:uncharacterized membrane protein
MDRRICALILFFIAALATLSVLKHEAYNSTALDLGLYDNMVWQFSHLKYGFNTVGGHYPFETHIMPIMFLLAPLYWLGQSPIVLLVLQAVAICMGALPLYWLAKEKSGSRMLAGAFAFAYLLNPTIHYTALFDFHTDALGLSFFMFAFYYAYRENWLMFALFALLGGLTKEYASLTIAMLGISIVILKRKWLIGAITALVGGLWFYANLFFSSLGSTVTNRYIISFSWLGGSLKEILLSMLTRPHVVIAHLLTIDFFMYSALLLAPGLWLSILAPEILMLAAPSAALVVLHESFSYTQIITHHNSYMLPFIFFASVWGAERYKKAAKKLGFPVFMRTNNAIAFAVIATAIISYAAYGPFTILYTADTINPFSAQANAARMLSENIPAGASVSAMTWAVPHLNHREKIYTFPNPFYLKDYGTKPWETGYAGGETDYVLVNLMRQDPLMNESYTEETLGAIMGDKSYGVIGASSGWVLLEKGASHDEGLCFLKNEQGSRFMPESLKGLISNRCN